MRVEAGAAAGGRRDASIGDENDPGSLPPAGPPSGGGGRSRRRPSEGPPATADALLAREIRGIVGRAGKRSGPVPADALRLFDVSLLQDRVLVLSSELQRLDSTVQSHVILRQSELLRASERVFGAEAACREALMLVAAARSATLPLRALVGQAALALGRALGRRAKLALLLRRVQALRAALALRRTVERLVAEGRFGEAARAVVEEEAGAGLQNDLMTQIAREFGRAFEAVLAAGPEPPRPRRARLARLDALAAQVVAAAEVLAAAGGGGAGASAALTSLTSAPPAAPPAPPAPPPAPPSALALLDSVSSAVVGACVDFCSVKLMESVSAGAAGAPSGAGGGPAAAAVVRNSFALGGAVADCIILYAALTRLVERRAGGAGGAGADGTAAAHDGRQAGIAAAASPAALFLSRLAASRAAFSAAAAADVVVPFVRAAQPSLARCGDRRVDFQLAVGALYRAVLELFCFERKMDQWSDGGGAESGARGARGSAPLPWCIALPSLRRAVALLNETVAAAVSGAAREAAAQLRARVVVEEDWQRLPATAADALRCVTAPTEPAVPDAPHALAIFVLFAAAGGGAGGGKAGGEAGGEAGGGRAGGGEVGAAAGGGRAGGKAGGGKAGGFGCAGAGTGVGSSGAGGGRACVEDAGGGSAGAVASVGGVVAAEIAVVGGGGGKTSSAGPAAAADGAEVGAAAGSAGASTCAVAGCSASVADPIRVNGGQNGCVGGVVGSLESHVRGDLASGAAASASGFLPVVRSGANPFPARLAKVEAGAAVPPGSFAAAPPPGAEGPVICTSSRSCLRAAAAALALAAAFPFAARAAFAELLLLGDAYFFAAAQTTLGRAELAALTGALAPPPGCVGGRRVEQLQTAFVQQLKRRQLRGALINLQRFFLRTAPSASANPWPFAPPKLRARPASQGGSGRPPPSDIWGALSAVSAAAPPPVAVPPSKLLQSPGRLYGLVERFVGVEAAMTYYKTLARVFGAGSRGGVEEAASVRGGPEAGRVGGPAASPPLSLSELRLSQKLLDARLQWAEQLREAVADGLARAALPAAAALGEALAAGKPLTPAARDLRHAAADLSRRISGLARGCLPRKALAAFWRNAFAHALRESVGGVGRCVAGPPSESAVEALCGVLEWLHGMPRGTAGGGGGADAEGGAEGGGAEGGGVNFGDSASGGANFGGSASGGANFGGSASGGANFGDGSNSADLARGASSAARGASSGGRGASSGAGSGSGFAAAGATAAVRPLTDYISLLRHYQFVAESTHELAAQRLIKWCQDSHAQYPLGQLLALIRRSGLPPATKAALSARLELFSAEFLRCVQDAEGKGS